MKSTLRDRILDCGLLEAQSLREAEVLAQQRQWPLARALLQGGFIARSTYAAWIGEQTGLEALALIGRTDAFALLEQLALPRYELERLQCWPLRREGTELEVAVLDPFDPEPARWIEALTGLRVRYRFALDVDLAWVHHTYFGRDLAADTVHLLFLEDPLRSAIQPFTPAQLLGIALLLTALLAGLYGYGTQTLAALLLALNGFYLLNILFKASLTLAGARRELHQTVSEEELAAVRQEELPEYSILIPVYREAAIVREIAFGLGRLDYPRDRLYVKLLLEQDDRETLEAIRELDVPAIFEPLIIPDLPPKTKPKACNYGLLFCRGQYITIYDAEDIPEPDQLKKVVVAFRKSPNEVIVLQAALNYYNAEENLLTRLFTLEYSYWFDYMLPGLDALRMPIPLGGTSNHFRMDKLLELHAWDPFNVTEDADLGIRAAARGYRVGIVNSTTYEEANKSLGNWIRQRSRWIKGYMQTFLVHIRRPIQLWRSLGGRAMIGFILFIGGSPLAFLGHLPLSVLFAGWLLFRWSWVEALFPGWALYVALFNFLVGNALMIYVNMVAVFRRGLYHLLPYAFLNPLYWLLHSVAAYKALWQLFFKPSYWEKTRHGLSQIRPSEMLARAA
mgnify:FL=1